MFYRQPAHNVCIPIHTFAFHLHVKQKQVFSPIILIYFSCTAQRALWLIIYWLFDKPNCQVSVFLYDLIMPALCCKGILINLTPKVWVVFPVWFLCDSFEGHKTITRTCLKLHLLLTVGKLEKANRTHNHRNGSLALILSLKHILFAQALGRFSHVCQHTPQICFAIQYWCLLNIFGRVVMIRIHIAHTTSEQSG